MNPGKKYCKSKCAVPGCNDCSSSRISFPANLDLLAKWCNAVKNPKVTPDVVLRNPYSWRVCYRHFADEDKLPELRRKIKFTAVPALHLPGVESDEKESLENSVTPTCKRPRLTEGVDENFEVGSSSICVADKTDATSCSSEILNTPANPVSYSEGIRDPTSARAVKKPTTSTGSSGRNPRRSLLGSFGVTRQSNLTPRRKKAYKMLRDSGVCLRRTLVKNQQFSERFADANRFALSPAFNNLMKDINLPTYRFFMSQLRNQGRLLMARRYTLPEKVLCLTLLKAGGRAYKMLSKMFALPSKKTLLRLLRSVPVVPGINAKLVDSLRRTVSEMDDMSRCAIIVWDEICLNTGVSYNAAKDLVEGLEDFGTERTNRIANHANVFLIKGAFKSWVQPFSFTLSKGPTSSSKLVRMISSVVECCQGIGLSVVASVCDQGANNRAAVNKLLASTKQSFLGREPVPLGYVINGQEVIHLYDVPHLIKCVRNQLLFKHLHFNHKGEEKVAKWDHILKYYEIDKEMVRLCPKITDEHVIPEKIKKMKVKYASQIFSYSLGSVLVRAAFWVGTTMPRDASQTGEFLLFMDSLFNSLNGNKGPRAQVKPLQAAVTLMSSHEEFWRASIKCVNSMRFFCPKKGVFTTPPCLKNLSFTLYGFIRLKKLLLPRLAQYLMTRKFNQDALENFFSSVRSHRSRNTNPTCANFITSFKALLVNNYSSCHSPAANCESDVSELLDNFQSYLTSESSQQSPVELPHDDVPEILISNMKFTKIENYVIAYIAGYFVRRALRLVSSCDFCKANYLYGDYNVHYDLIEAKEYKPGTLIRPGSFVTYVVGQALNILYYLLPQCIARKNLVLFLKLALSKNVSLNPLRCTQHPEIIQKFSAILVKAIVRFYIKDINRILNGTDSRFERRVVKNESGLDPLMKHAHDMYMQSRKKKKSNSV